MANGADHPNAFVLPSGLIGDAGIRKTSSDALKGSGKSGVGDCREFHLLVECVQIRTKFVDVAGLKHLLRDGTFASRDFVHAEVLSSSLLKPDFHFFTNDFRALLTVSSTMPQASANSS